MKFSTLVIVIIVYVQVAQCSLQDIIHNRVQKLKKRASQMYGAVNNSDIKLWEYELGDRLAYPRGNKQKLSDIAKLWTQYYECCAHALAGRRATSLTAYAGAVARLPCALCVAPGESAQLEWTYAESLYNLTFAPAEDKETYVFEDEGLTMYHVQAEDAGVYRCQVGLSEDALVALEVVDADNYTVVKPASSRGPHAASPRRLTGALAALAVRSSWSRWSECSRCGRVGRRRRYGLCHVGLARRTRDNFEGYEITNKTPNVYLADDINNLFEAFPAGIGCRSQYLPPHIRGSPEVWQRQNEIMIAMCKVPCKDNVIFELRSHSGRVFERANNSAGEFSLLQRPPPQPPPPARDIVFATRGELVAVRCPGTSLRDTPVQWRCGTRHVQPRGLYTGSNGRARVDARDRLVLGALRAADAGVYSCWQAGELAGTVKLVVQQGARTGWGPRAKLLALLCGAAALLRASTVLLRCVQRRAGAVRSRAARRGI